MQLSLTYFKLKHGLIWENTFDIQLSFLISLSSDKTHPHVGVTPFTYQPKTGKRSSSTRE